MVFLFYRRLVVKRTDTGRWTGLSRGLETLQAPIRSRPSGAVFAAPGRGLTDQREDTQRVIPNMGQAATARTSEPILDPALIA